MPDEPRHGDSGWHPNPASANPDGYERPGRRRRRSMEDSGGVSVSDLVARHGASQPNMTPVAPPPSAPRYRDQDAEPFGESEPAGRRARRAAPEAEPTGRRARRAAPEPPPSPPPAPPRGRRAAASSRSDRSEISRNDLPPVDPDGQDVTSRVRRPSQPPRALPPQYRRRQQDTGRTRSGNDIAAPRSPEPPQAEPPSDPRIAPARSAPRARPPSARQAMPPAPQQAPPPAQPTQQQPALRPEQPSGPMPAPRSSTSSGTWDRPAPTQGNRSPAPNRPRRPRTSGPQPGTGQHPIPQGPQGPQGPIDEPPPLRRPGTGRMPMPGRPAMPPPVDEQPVGNRLNPEPEAPQAPEPGPAGPPQGQANPSSKPRLQPAPGPEPREAMDPICLTSEMEPISEEVQKKRKVDATLVRFSAVHDEMVREERERRSRRARLMPWLNKDNDLDDALTEMGNSGPAPARATVNTAEHQSLADDDLESVPDDDQPPEKSGRSGRRLGKGASGGPPRKPPGGTGKNPAARRPPRKRNSKAVLGAKIGATGAAVLILVLTFMGWHARAQVENTPVAQVAALDENSSYIQDAQRQMGDENFLIVGTSTDNGVATPAVSTVMVAHIPTDRSQAVVVSFPTDLAVDRPACTRWNNQASATTAEQVAPQNDVALGAVYQVGGPKCLTEAVQSVSGLRINHFVGIDAAGFSSLVSQASGIPLCVKAPISDSVLGNVVGQTGQVTLSGQQALNFVQASHVTGDTLANHGQIHRQQVLMAAALRQAVSGQGLLLSTSKLNDFLATFTKSSFGQNMGVDDLITLAQSLQATDLGKVNFVTLPTTGTLDAAGAETPVTSDDNQLFGELINNSPLPGASGGTATTAGSNSVVDPKTIKIQVLNAGNTTDNIAKDTAAKLAGQGFQILTKGTDSPVAKTVIRYSADEQAAARTLSSSVPGATLQVDPSLNGAIILDIGPGFDGKVQAPSATGGSTATTGSGTAPQLSTVNAKDTGCA